MGRTPRWALGALVGLTAIAFALRVSTLNQSLFGDELFMWARVHGRGLGATLHDVRAQESTPPLYFVLAWISAHLFDGTSAIRIPSLLFGTAAVPATFLLGRRAIDWRAGLLAAALLAVSPFAIFYAIEARTYGTMMFLVALSTFLLLRALETGGRGRWVAFGVVTWLSLFTHYTVVFVPLSQFAWALWAHPVRRRQVLIANGAVALAYVPWLPFVRSHAAGTISGLYPLTLHNAAQTLGRVALGHPFVPISDLPGTAGLALAALVAVLVAVGLLLRRHEWRDVPRAAWLITVLAIATPAGLLIASIAKDIFLPRDLSASVPAGMVLAAAALLSLPRALCVVAATALLAAFAVGALREQEQRFQRPDYRAVAAAVDADAAPRDPVVEVIAQPGPPGRPLDPNLKRPRRIFGLVGVRHVGFVTQAIGDPRAWRVRGARRVFVTGPLTPGFALPAPPAGSGWRLSRRERFAGFVPVGLDVYAR